MIADLDTLLTAPGSGGAGPLASTTGRRLTLRL